MICKHCGRELREDAKFCGICGTSVDLEETLETENTTEAAAEETISEQPAPEQPATEQSAETANVQKPTEPLKFGAGIVAFCAVLIFLLSVTCGVFAGLFFSERGKNAVSVKPSCAVVSEFSQW